MRRVRDIHGPIPAILAWALGGLRYFIATLLAVFLSGLSMAQGTEDFTNLPATPTPGSYIARTWTGTDGVTWTAEGARTDQTMTGKAICLGNSGNRWVTSPSYANGMGTLTFDYVRGFTGTGARTIQVWVNGVQIGVNIAVSPTSDVVQTYSQAINMGGPVQLEIRSTGAAQVKLDNIAWVPYVAGPTVTMDAPASSALESAGSVTVTLNISPAATAAETITIGVVNGPGAIYGIGNDYTTAPVTTAGAITRTVPIGATSVTFSINITDDVVTEGDETITFTITGASAGLSLGSALAHTFTITDNDVTPTVNFSTLSISVLEAAGTQTFNLSINPAAPVAGSITIQVTNGPGVTYGPNPNDYVTAPAPLGGFITVNFLAGATSASFNATVINDLNPESTEQVTFTLSAVPVGFAMGSNNTGTLTIGDNDTPATVLEPGDLIIVGVNANNYSCMAPIPANVGIDHISFFCFKPITYGTSIFITDNGYSRCSPGQWGDTEGAVEITRTGITIPAGQVITIAIANTSGTGNVVGLAPDANWSCTSLNGLTSVNLNAGGDQLFFGQGGTWTNPGGTHNANYSGTIIYGFSTNPSAPWTPSCGSNQQSGLPPGIECFSMAPTLSTDFNKYTGPIVPQSQRDWIIAADNVGNWSTHLSCSDYNSDTPDWLTAPILPITVAPFVAGRWRGSTSTDWFDCKNWDDARVPDIVTPVVIDPTWAARNCEVGLVPASAAECASILHTSGAAARQLIVRNGSTLTIDGPLTISRTAPAGLLTTSVLDNSELNCSTLTVTGTTAGAINEAIFRCDAGGTVRVEEDLTIGVGGLLDLATPGGTLWLGGDWVNLEDETHFQEAGSSVILNGNVDQNLTISSGPEVFSRVQLAKSGGDLLLNTPIEVRTELDLSSGRIMNTATELVTLRAGSTALNASDASFVHGPVQKIGNSDFTFPVGKGGSLRPCGLTGITGLATGAFTAEYFPISAYTWGSAMEPTLDRVSDCEYWIIDRTAGTGNAVVVLSWDTPESCGVTEPNDLRVARWDGSLWLDRGNGGASPLAAFGTVPSAGAQTLFSPWTLASINGLNPLPISLVDFTAKPEGDRVRLDWITASEQDNALFTVERSADASIFEPVLHVPGAGNSVQVLHYTDVDPRPLSGLSYYRLMQTDVDGTSTHSRVVSVYMGRPDLRPLVVFGTADNLTALHGFPEGSRYELMDMTGRLVAEGTVTQTEMLNVTVAGLQRGAYLFRIIDGDRMESVRFVY